MQVKVLLPLLALSFQFINPCSPQNKPTRTPTETDTIHDVQITCLDIVGKPRTHEAEGLFEPSEKAVITASVTSEVTQVLVGEGDAVAEGDPVVMLSGADLQLRADLLRAQQKEIDARLKKSQADLKSLGKVEDRPVSNEETKFLDEEDYATPPPEPKQYGPAETSKKPSTLNELVDVLAAMSERYAKKVEILDKQLLDLTQKSPVKGIVVKVHASAKNHVDERTALVEIAQTDPMSVVFQLPEDVANFVDKHSTVTVTLVDAPKITGEGNVFFIDPNVDQSKRTITIKAHVANLKNDIKGGQKATVVVATRKVDEHKMVSKKALVFDKKKIYLYFVEVNQARMHEVKTTGKEDPKGRVEVMTDLTSDDPIIINKPETLMNGAFVRIVGEKNAVCETHRTLVEDPVVEDSRESTGGGVATSTGTGTKTGVGSGVDIPTPTGDVPGGGF